jgi:pentatricopeptide repeat domain-containing protein 1
MLIEQCFEEKRPDLATQLYDHLRAEATAATTPAAAPVPLAVFDVLLQGYGRAGDRQRLAQVQRDMREAGVRPDMSTYTILIDAWGKAGDLRRMWQAWDDMREQGLRPNVVVYTSVIATLGKLGDIEAMERTFAEMQRSSGDEVEPNRTTYNAMVHSYGQQQMMDKMEALVERMRADPSLGLDSFTHAAVVAAWSRAGRVDKAMEAFDSIAATGAQPSLHAWTAILHMLGGAGRSDEMLRMLDKMKRLGVKPSTAVYNTIINAFGKARNIHSMMDTFKAMRRFVHI